MSLDPVVSRGASTRGEQDAVLLSAIIPVRNEEGILWESASTFAGYFDQVVGQGKWQFVIVENGSTDRSPEITQKIIERWPTSLSKTLAVGDYGNALREGLLAANGEWSLILNADHLWDAPYLEWSWNNRNDYDLIIGSKRADPTLNGQDQYRRVLSAGLNAVLLYLFDCVVAESHGMKFIRMERLRSIAEQCVMRRGLYDTELTLRTLRGGFWVAELPIPYLELRKPRNLMFRKILQNVVDMVRFWNVMKDVRYEGNIKYRRFCRADML